MKTSNSKERIAQLMSELRLNQTEFCNRAKIQKSALSNYLNGDRVPRQDQISKIADAFHVSASWLMGYDVPMYETLSNDIKPDEMELIMKFRYLDEYGAKNVLTVLSNEFERCVAQDREKESNIC